MAYLAVDSAERYLILDCFGLSVMDYLVMINFDSSDALISDDQSRLVS